MTELPQIVQTIQKDPHGRNIKFLSNKLASLFEWSQFCFKLYPFVVVEMDVLTYEEARLLIGLEFRLVNALGFEY